MRRLLCIAILMALSLCVVDAQAPGARVSLYGMKRSGQSVELLFRVAESETGRDIIGLQQGDLLLLEDGVALNGSFELSEASVDATTPARTVELTTGTDGIAPVQGSKPAALAIVGSTIGIVFDASALTRERGQDVQYYTNQGRALIEAFLEAGRPIAPEHPEALSLFVPLSAPAVAGETLQPALLTTFVQDRNVVLNAVIQQQPRPGKTLLFDTIRAAVTSTAAAASTRGTDAYLLIVSDGGDTASIGSYDALVQEATARKVRLLILGVGPQASIAKSGALLQTLATSTGGAYLGSPDAAAVQAMYRQMVGVTGQSVYMLRYTTALLDDGKQHTLAIRVSGTHTGESEPIPLAAIGSGPASEPAALPLGLAVQNYAIRAISLAVVISLAMTALLLLLKRLGTGVAASNITRY